MVHLFLFRYFIRLHTIGECAYYPPENRFVGLVNRTTSVVADLTDSEESFEELEQEYQGHGIIGLAHQFEAYFKGETFTAALAQLGERQTEDLKAPCSIHGGGILFGWPSSTIT